VRRWRRINILNLRLEQQSFRPQYPYAALPVNDFLGDLFLVRIRLNNLVVQAVEG